MIKKELLTSLLTLVVLLTALQLTSINKFIYRMPEVAKDEIFTLQFKPPTSDIVLINTNNQPVDAILDKALSLYQDVRYMGIDLSSYNLEEDQIKMIALLSDSVDVVVAGNHPNLSESAIVKSDVVTHFVNDSNSFELSIASSVSNDKLNNLNGNTSIINYSGNYAYFTKYDFEDDLPTYLDLENTIIICGDLGEITPFHPITSTDLTGEPSALTTPINPERAYPDMYQVEISAMIVNSVIEGSVLRSYEWSGYFLVILFILINWLTLKFAFKKSIILFWTLSYFLIALESIIVTYIIVYSFDIYNVILDFKYAQLLILLGILTVFAKELLNLKKTDYNRH